MLEIKNSSKIGLSSIAIHLYLYKKKLGLVIELKACPGENYVPTDKNLIYNIMLIILSDMVIGQLLKSMDRKKRKKHFQKRKKFDS